MFDDKVEEKYFCQALDLLNETQWLYKFPVTELLIRNSLELFPEEWILALRDMKNEELNELVVNRKINKVR